MIFEVQSYRLIFQDIIYSLAIGFLAGFIHQLISIFLYRKKWAIFIKDFLTCIVFTVLIYSYTASFANYHILRWYNVLGGLIGFILFMPCFSALGQMLLLLLKITIKYLAKQASAAFIRAVAKQKEKIMKNSQKITKKVAHRVLQNDSIVLYN